MKHFSTCMFFIFLITVSVTAQTVQEFPVAVGPDSTFAWNIASDGTNYLIPIVGNETGQNALTCQLIAADGTLQGSRISLNGNGYISQTIWDGSRYFVVSNTTEGNIVGQFLTSTGTPDGTPLTIATQASLKEGCQCTAQINTELFVLYIKDNLLYGQRISKSGFLLGTPLQISTSGQTKEFALATDGTRYLVAWYNKNSTDGNNAIYGRLVNADGTTATDIFTIEGPNPDHNPLTLVYDGSRYYLSYDLPLNYSSPAIHGVFGRFISISGAVGDRITITSSANASNSITSVGYGNGVYLVTWISWGNLTQGEAYLKGKYLNQNGETLSEEFTIAAPLNGKIPLGLDPFFTGEKFLLGFNRVEVTSEGQFTNGDVYGAFITLPASDVQRLNNATAQHFSLWNNYPNPFNPTTTIRFSLPSQTFVVLKIYNILGAEVATLVSKELPGGEYSIQWNATNFPTGVYFYKLETKHFSETKKMLLIK